MPKFRNILTKTFDPFGELSFHHQEYKIKNLATIKLNDAKAKIAILNAAKSSGEEVDGAIVDAQTQLQEAKKTLHDGNMWASAILISFLLCGSIVFMIFWHGYGSYLGYGGCLFLFIIMYFLGDILNDIWFLIRGRWSTLKGQPLKIWRIPNFKFFILCGSLFLAGWCIGIQARKAYCRSVCRSCEPIIQALDEYRAKHEFYPISISNIPDFAQLLTASNITVRQGKFLKDGIGVSDVGDADVTIYLSPIEYKFIVPIERPLLMSFTRFHVYMRSSLEKEWKHDYFIWRLSAMD